MNHNNDNITRAIDRLHQQNTFAETLTPPSIPIPPSGLTKPRCPGSRSCPWCGQSSLLPSGYYGEACCPHCKRKFDIPYDCYWELAPVYKLFAPQGRTLRAHKGLRRGLAYDLRERFYW